MDDAHQMSLNSTLVELTAQIVAAYVGKNAVPVSDLPMVISSVASAIQGLGSEPAVASLDKPIPAVPIKKSVTPDFIICLEDGKKMKMLKRHLRSTYGMSPDDYRAKWGLPADYPMVAPNYAEQRSKLAQEIGLGKNGRRR